MGNKPYIRLCCTLTWCNVTLSRTLYKLCSVQVQSNHTVCRCAVSVRLALLASTLAPHAVARSRLAHAHQGSIWPLPSAPRQMLHGCPAHEALDLRFSRFQRALLHRTPFPKPARSVLQVSMRPRPATSQPMLCAMHAQRATPHFTPHKMLRAR